VRHVFDRRIVVVAGALVGVVVVAGVAASILLASHKAPTPLALRTPAASGPAVALAGRWTVGPGSQVGYRVKEKFINQPTQTEAVARTSKVTGSLVVAGNGSTVSVTEMKVTVDLASLTSQDKYANYQVYQRDGFIRSIYLQTSTYPRAMFVGDATDFVLPTNGPVKVDVGGKLTVHGETRQVTAHLQAQGLGQQAEVAGQIVVDMRDFGVEVPDISFTTADSSVTIEFDLMLVHSH
jgi:polyisoprenoid-binding protein YceI